MPRSILPAVLLTTALTLSACAGDEYATSAQSGPTGATTPAAENAGAQKPIEFEYAGRRGPIHWGSLSRRYAECSDGSAQSPIELSGATPTKLPNLQFDYKEGALNLLNTTHTVQADETPGSRLTADGDIYPLLQFHFHEPSEHTMNGRRFDGELHFVHRDSAGHVAVVGVFVRLGKANTQLARVFDALPGTPKQTASVPDFNPSSLLPTGSRKFTTYGGSLTTPPCSEGVRWYVLSTPIEASKAQLAKFRSVISENSRPTQPRHGRTVRVDRG